jgi:hypothetical protein
MDGESCVRRQSLWQEHLSMERSQNLWPEQYGSFRNGVLCLNSRYHEISPCNKISLSCWMISLICLIGGYVMNLWFHDLIFSLLLSSVLALVYGEMRKWKCSSVEKILKLPPTEDEKVMAAINIANCQISIRKVKINEDGSPSFRITITHKTLRWHVWRFILFASTLPLTVNRKFEEFESAQKQLKIDFPTCMSLSILSPLSPPSADYGADHPSTPQTLPSFS